MADESIPGPAYRIETARLVLRNWNPADTPLAHAAIEASLEHLKPWMLWAQNSLPMQERLNYIRRSRSRFDAGESFAFGIFNPDETEVWGGCGLHLRQARVYWKSAIGYT